VVVEHHRQELDVNPLAAADETRCLAKGAVERVLNVIHWGMDSLLHAGAQRLDGLDQLLRIFARDGDAAAIEFESIVFDRGLNRVAVLRRGDLHDLRQMEEGIAELFQVGDGALRGSRSEAKVLRAEVLPR